jgi:major type 1 subunit fimbrin (pilin)
MRAIQIQLDAPAGVINQAGGIFSASGDSTVQGVALVITDGSGGAFSLGTMHTVSQYNQSTGGTYPLGFNLAYYRTGPLSAGDLKAQITYTMSYQ